MKILKIFEYFFKNFHFFAFVTKNPIFLEFQTPDLMKSNFIVPSVMLSFSLNAYSLMNLAEVGEIVDKFLRIGNIGAIDNIVIYVIIIRALFWELKFRIFGFFLKKWAFFETDFFLKKWNFKVLKKFEIEIFICRKNRYTKSYLKMFVSHSQIVHQTIRMVLSHRHALTSIRPLIGIDPVDHSAC